MQQVSLPATSWNRHQQAIFAHDKPGHIVVIAGPGCGKTTTLVELANRMRDRSVIAVAFGRDIAKTLHERLSHGDGRTTHSVGFETVRHSLGQHIELDRDRAWKLAEMFFPERHQNRLKQALCETLSKSKARLAHTKEEILDVISDFMILTSPLDAGTFAEVVVELLNLSARPTETTNSIDYDDQLWLPVVCPWMEPRIKYNEVLVDEVQDFTLVQMRVVKSLVKPGGRLVLFGDPNQAIFGFRGAGGMHEFAGEIEATELPLSVCYRCAASIVEEARVLVPRLEPAPNTIRGTVTRVGLSTLLKEVRPGDFVLSRSNAPLVKLCLMLLRDGKRAHIEGRDIGKTLGAFVRRLKPQNPEDLRNKVKGWAEQEVARLNKTDPPKPADDVHDRVECVLLFANGASTVEQIVDRIEEAFSSEDSLDYVTLSTVHRAKGKERKRVWMLESTFARVTKRLEIMRREREAPGEEIDAKLQEETNIRYVAITRAQEFLAYVEHDFSKALVEDSFS